MPIQNGEYVAPQWTNNAPPPLNASELQAICDTVESNQDKYTKEENLSQNAKNALRFGTTQSVKFLTNYYTGNGGIYNNNMFLVCTTAGIFASQDGITWTRKYVPATIQENIIFANGMYTTVGNNTIYYTTDINAETGWQSISTPSGTNGLKLIIYGNGMYMAAGGHSSLSSIVYSNDGISWNKSQYPTNTQIMSIAYFDGYFYASTRTDQYRTQNFTSWESSSGAIPVKSFCSTLGHLYFYGANGNLYERNGNVWEDTGINNIGTMIGNDDFCAIIEENENSLLFTTDFRIFNRYSIITTGTMCFILYDGKNTIVIGPEMSMAVNTVTMVDESETPSDAFVAIANEINNIPGSIADELASMIRSGVESTLV